MSTSLRSPTAGDDQAVIIGAGIGGLAAAIDLASAGLSVTLIERSTVPGGKLRQVRVGDAWIDAGPTVFTLRSAFEALFEDAGCRLEDFLELQPVERLARHAWEQGGRLDLYADSQRSAEAIGDFAGAAEARRFHQFLHRAADINATLERTFMRAQRPNPVSLTHRIGYRNLPALLRIRPFTTLWRALSDYFHDPRLRQLFGRYATYCGSSPFQAPATLMLIAHVEAQGVWQIRGGMHQLARALEALARQLGVAFEYGREVSAVETRADGVDGVRTRDGERYPASIVISNADAAALHRGLLGNKARRAVPAQRERNRSQSAITWNLVAKTSGFPLHHHTVFFSRDYPAEFDAVFRRDTPPERPTVYVCAQDRQDDSHVTGSERLLCLINAPARGDRRPFTDTEIQQCEQRTFELLERCGLTLQSTADPPAVTTPNEFERLFPGTGGALYGMASHGWMASFQRPPAKTRIPGLYLAGGSAHPGAGLPMAMTSGRLAATQALTDRTSAKRSSRAATGGGTSTR